MHVRWRRKSQKRPSGLLSLALNPKMEKIKMAKRYESWEKFLILKCDDHWFLSYLQTHKEDQNPSINDSLASSDSDDELERDQKRKARKARARNRKVKMNYAFDFFQCWCKIFTLFFRKSLTLEIVRNWAMTPKWVLIMEWQANRPKNLEKSAFVTQLVPCPKILIPVTTKNQIVVLIVSFHHLKMVEHPLELK